MSARKLPPVPAAIASRFGPVPVTIEAGLEERRDALGLFEPKRRHVTLEADVCELTRWQTFFHEEFHVALWDGGSQLGKEQEEFVCDLYAALRVAEMLARR